MATVARQIRRIGKLHSTQDPEGKTVYHFDESARTPERVKEISDNLRFLAKQARIKMRERQLDEKLNRGKNRRSAKRRSHSRNKK